MSHAHRRDPHSEAVEVKGERQVMRGKGVNFEALGPTSVDVNMREARLTSEQKDLGVVNRSRAVAVDYSGSVLHAEQGEVDFSVVGGAPVHKAYWDGNATSVQYMPMDALVAVFKRFQEQNPDNSMAALSEDVLRSMGVDGLRQMLISLLPPEEKRRANESLPQAAPAPQQTPPPPQQSGWLRSFWS